MVQSNSSHLPRCTLSPLRGFTLQEMVVSLVISGILASGSFGIWRVAQDSKITVAANDLVSHLALARSEAIRHRTRAMMCPTNDNKSCAKAGNDYTSWHKGWLIYTDNNGNTQPDGGEIVRLHAGTSRGVVIRTSRYRNRVTYQPTGMAGGSTITFAVCDARDSALARYVIISIVGRARVARTTASNMKCDK